MVIYVLGKVEHISPLHVSEEAQASLHPSSEVYACPN